MGIAEIFVPLYWVIVAAIFVAMVVEFRGLFGALWVMLAEMWAARDRPIWRRQAAPRGQQPRACAACPRRTRGGGTRSTAAGPDPGTGQDRRHL